MMFGEPTGQRFGQCRDLGAQPAFGQIGQCAGSLFPTINDSSMARPETPRMLEATADPWVPPADFGHKKASRVELDVRPTRHEVSRRGLARTRFRCSVYTEHRTVSSVDACRSRVARDRSETVTRYAVGDSMMRQTVAARPRR